MKRHTNKGIRKVCAHPRRRWSECECSWYFNFKYKETHYRLSLDKYLGEHIDSKSAAEDAAADIRKQIKAGKFNQPEQPKPQQATLTVGHLLDCYRKDYLVTERKASLKVLDYQIGVIKRTPVERLDGQPQPFGDWLVADVQVGAINRYKQQRQPHGLTATNRELALLRACWNWSILQGTVAAIPFKVGGVTAVKLAEEHARSRRLQPGEADALLAVCGPHLRALVEAALATGCRRGELLSLQWKQVEGMVVEQVDDEWSIRWLPRAEVFLPHQKTKTKKDRRIPISTRLKSILEMRRFDPEGEPHASDKYVFGNEIGEQCHGFARAWRRAVLVSHGYQPQYQKREQEGAKPKRTAVLAADSRKALKVINLHFHDLRREAGSRWLDGGMSLHAVRDLLGHANVSQTSTYLSTTETSLHAAMAQYERLQQFATGTRKRGKTKVQTATSRTRKTNKTAPDHHPAIM